VYKAKEGGNNYISFWQRWQELVSIEHKNDRERALQLEQLFKFHSTFMSFNKAGVLEFNYEHLWISMSEEQHSTRHYTNVV